MQRGGHLVVSVLLDFSACDGLVGLRQHVRVRQLVLHHLKQAANGTQL